MTLTVEDLTNPMFDKQKPRRHYIPVSSDRVDAVSEKDRERYEQRLDAFEEFLIGDNFNPGDIPVLEELVIEGVTVTDDFNTVGFTYFLSDDTLYISVLRDNGGERAYTGKARTYEEFDKRLKYVDKKLRKKR